MGKHSRPYKQQVHDEARLKRWNVIFFLDQTPPTKILLLKRSSTKDFAPNKYTGIGGKVDPDETIEQSAYRELGEETGMKDILLTHFADVIFDNDDSISCYTALLDPTILPTCNEGELEWVAVSDLFSKPLVDTARAYLSNWKEKGFAFRPAWTVLLKATGKKDGIRQVDIVDVQEGLYTNNMSEVKKGIYMHYKGTKATVLGVAKHSETKEEFVVYEHEDPQTGKMELWIRPKSMFLESVEVNGKTMPRFRFITSK